MSDLSPLIQAYFTRRIALEQGAGPDTVACYRDTIRLLVRYVCQQTGKQPARQGLADLDAGMVSAFLDHLETSRGNSVATRNIRLFLSDWLAADPATLEHRVARPLHRAPQLRPGRAPSRPGPVHVPARRQRRRTALPAPPALLTPGPQPGTRTRVGSGPEHLTTPKGRSGGRHRADQVAISGQNS
jgi:hypothetical protein